MILCIARHADPLKPPVANTPPPSLPASLLTRSARDVTDVFEAFHREPRHRAILEAYRIGTLVGYTPSELVKEFRSLKQEIEEEGLFEVGRRRCWGRPFFCAVALC